MAALAAFSLACGPEADSDEEECDDPAQCEAADDDDDDDADDDDDDAEGDDDDDDAAAGDIPCDIQDLLAANCWECHDDPLAFGAAMPLRTLDDFRVPAITDATISVGDLVGARVVDESRPMPPGGLMSEEAIRTLQEWIDAGTPGEDAGTCNTAGDDDDDDDDWGPDALPCEPDQVFLASANGNADDGGFQVPQTDDLYQCFVFDSPFGEDTQGTAWAPIIDDERVVHHWLMLKTDNPEYQHGDVFPCSGALTLDTTMVVGWAPGTPNFVLGDDVGLELPGPGEKMVLQIHYNNVAGHTDAIDRSGVAVCTTEEKRENTAATLWLGHIDFAIPPGGTETVVGDCDTNRLEEPVNMLVSWPHMHEYGTAIRTELIPGGDGTPEMLVDVPQWNFDNQIYYPHDPVIRVEPGDILRTTCEFQNPTDQTVTFGEGTGDEMCFNFAIVYPIDAFDFPNPFGPPTLGRYCLGGIPI